MATRTVLRGARSPGDIAIEDGKIAAIGAVEARRGDEVVECSGDLVTAGFVNCHHHLYQWMTRGRATACDLFTWLRTLYPIWGELTVDDVAAAALVGLGELALSGATLVSDHHYVVPRGDDSVFDAIAGAAKAVGVRLELCRGSMDLGESRGGLPPDTIVEEIDAILASTEAVARRLNDGDRVRVAVAPCSPFSVSVELMRASAELARSLGLRLHTHLAETLEEERDCRARFGRRPVELMEEFGWVGDDVWFAHGIHLSAEEITRLGSASTGVAHCPSSNARLAAGICPVRELIDAGARIGLGVDGPASNEMGVLLPELRQAVYFAAAAVGTPRCALPGGGARARHLRRGGVPRQRSSRTSGAGRAGGPRGMADGRRRGHPRPGRCARARPGPEGPAPLCRRSAGRRRWPPRRRRPRGRASRTRTARPTPLGMRRREGPLAL